MTRTERFFKNGIPKYVRCYDNGGETADRYTVVYTGRYRHMTGGEFLYIAMSGYPTHPQGIGQHGGSRNLIDRPKYAHLGKKISFDALPEDCQRVVLFDYRELWNIPEKDAEQ